MTRWLLWGLTNILIVVMISIVLNLLGVQPYLTSYGINYESLMVFCLVWGMGGSFISLFLSKTMAKWMYRLKYIDPNRSSGVERDLYMTVDRLAKSAGLPKTPDVAVYQSPEVNAFATGPSKGNALVAVSTGLLQRMGKDEVDGVLGHEVAHIANGDMVTMTLIQGVINAFVMFFARIAAFAVSNMMRSNDDRDGGSSWFVQMGLIFLFEIVFGLLGQIVVSSFSRMREFRADAGSARLGGRDKMIAALQALKGTTEMVDTSNAAIASLKISGKRGGLMAMLSTHPSLDDRIQRLRTGQF